MIKSRYPRKRLVLYLVPILMGLGGIQFSLLLDDIALRGIMTMVSVAIPLISFGNLLARFQISLLERVFLLLGVLLLLFGAGLSLSGFAEAIEDGSYMSQRLAFYYRMIGIGSLLLGLVVVLYTVARTGEDVEGMAERFMYLTNHMHEGFVLSRADGPILMVNKRFLEMFGAKESEVLGQTPLQLADRFHIQEIKEHIEKRQQKIASEYEVTWRVEGEEHFFWFSGTPILNRFGRHYANLATVRDVTEQRRLARRVERYAQGLQSLVEERTRQLQASEERFRTLLLSMNEGFLTIDGSNRVQFANKRAYDLLKVGESELLDRDILDFVDTAGRVRLVNLLVKRDALPDEEARLELSFVDAEGGAVPAMLAVTYLPYGNPPEPAHSLVITAVSELKQMQLQLQQRALELEELNEELLMHDRAKDSFLSNVSHELRTPLSTIQGYVEMLESGSLGDMPPEQRSALHVMDRNVKRLVGHLNEIIEFSRMEIRGVQINKRLILAGSLVTESVSSFYPGAVAQKVALETHVSEDLPPVWCDREKMDQVLGIMLSNALKFTPEGGKISVRAECAPERTLRILVSDTGIGIRKEVHQRVFDKFYQVDGSKTRRYEGTGIGLSIAKSIVEAHGGSISIDSEVGKGCTFAIDLPRAQFDADWDHALLQGLKPMDILIVDEGKAFRAALEMVLTPLDIHPRAAPNGYQCVRELEKKKPDLILLNDTARDVAGLDTLSLLRQSLSADTVSVIAFSVENAEKLREANSLWGDIHFVSKPFTAQDLAEALQLVINGNEAARSSGQRPPDQAPTTLKKILVVDSDPGLLEWVETAMNHRQVLAYCASTPFQAMELLHTERPDVLFVDIDVPGYGVAEQLEKLLPRAREQDVPLYTMTGIPQHMRTPDGVAGCLRKPFTTDDLMALIEKHAHPGEVTVMT